MNPCQGHILELKLAAIQALEYNDFWLIFGEGRHPGFDKLLTTKLSPFLSSYVPSPPFQKKALFSNMMGFYKDTPTLIGKPMRLSSHAISTFEATVAGLFVSPRLHSLSPVLEAMSSACVRRALRLNRKGFGKRRLDPFS